MEKRRFGRTGHMSTVAIIGGAGFGRAAQADVDASMELSIKYGVNHIDIAPSYGEAELRIAPWMKRMRKDFFLGCKTTERTKAGAAAEMRRSLERMGVDSFDLYQIHAVTSMEELDKATGPGGALEAMIEAREQGLTKYIGITGHGIDSPRVFLEALRRFDFDSVLFPYNFVQAANPVYKRYAEELIHTCRVKDVGTMVIKSVCRGPWKGGLKTHNTWYEPFTDLEHIQPAINFVLSQDITGICMAGDTRVVPFVLEACENFQPLTMEEQEKLIAASLAYEPLFV
ncbi:MAG TPA: aldo/keto reductase [Anaerolineaceae bacterium]